jgi:hypothetical protein
MSNIGGKKRETPQFTETQKKVGLFEAKVIAINPDTEEYKDVLGVELKEDSKATEYLGKSQDGNITLRIDVWLEEIKNKDKFKVTFFLENKERENKDGSKKQYINNIGSCSWAADTNDLAKWFSERDYRVANVGEEDVYNFMRTWLGELDYRDAETTLELDWKKLMKGNVKDLKSQVDGEYCTNVVALATIRTVIKEDKTNEYQGVYNKAFLAPYNLKQFRPIDFSKMDILSGLRAKKSKDLKPHERFVLTVTGEYGCKDFYTLKDLKDYNAEDNFAASDKVISEDGADF